MEEIVFVFGVILGVAALGYLLVEQSGLLSVKLTAQQIAGYARAAGFADEDLPTAVAIALAESSGDPEARGDKTATHPGGTSYGLWQIHWTVHPEVGAPENLFDPQTNANAAYAVYLEQGWEAWSTYGNAPGHNNAYAAYLAQANAAVSA
jgi:Lysozyme like domain